MYENMYIFSLMSLLFTCQLFSTYWTASNDKLDKYRLKMRHKNKKKLVSPLTSMRTSKTKTQNAML